MGKKDDDSKHDDKPKAGGNPEKARAMRELRRSNASSPHVPAPLKGTRGEQERQAIDDFD